MLEVNNIIYIPVNRRTRRTTTCKTSASRFRPHCYQPWRLSLRWRASSGGA